MSQRVLLVEDDAALARVLTDNLVYEGFVVEWIANGRLALRQARLIRPDVVILDLMIPGLDGFEVCQSLSSDRDRLPIIMLTARTQHEDKVRGLELGADDYLTKPFEFDELLARIHAVLRRSQRTIHRLALGEVVVDFALMRAWKGTAALALTAREFALLQYLAERAGRVITRDELLRAVWGYDEVPLTRTVDIFVGRLRRKIEGDSKDPRFIRTVHGDGYTLMFEQS